MLVKFLAVYRAVQLWPGMPTRFEARFVTLKLTIGLVFFSTNRIKGKSFPRLGSNVVGSSGAKVGNYLVRT